MYFNARGHAPNRAVSEAKLAEWNFIISIRLCCAVTSSTFCCAPSILYEQSTNEKSAWCTLNNTAFSRIISLVLASLCQMCYSLLPFHNNYSCKRRAHTHTQHTITRTPTVCLCSRALVCSEVAYRSRTTCGWEMWCNESRSGSRIRQKIS